jgi:hypothetical protein
VKNNSLFFVFLILVLLIFQGWLVKHHVAEFAEFPPGKDGEVSFKSAGSVVTQGVNLGGAMVEKGAEPLWNRTRWVPEAFEKKLFQISIARQGAVATKGKTLVDANVQLNSVKAFVAYLPRAFQLGLLSPLPELWGGEGSTPAMTMARKIMGGVTIIFYVCLVGLLAGIVLFRKNLGFWIILTFCLLGVLVYAFTMPNVGTLLRYRYGFYMVLISFGAASIVELTLTRRNSRPVKRWLDRQA